MRVLLVVNPTAAGVNERKRVAVEDVLAAQHDLSVAVTAERDHATELAREAVEGGVEAVAVLGGDGTLNEAANGLVGSSTALGTLPGGSTSVFARTLGFTNDVVRAVEELSAAMAKGSRRRIEMGTANGRHCLFHVGAGFDAEVVSRVEGLGELKRRLGQGAFVYAAVSTWARQPERATPQFSVRIDDGSVHEGSFAICLKTNPYTYFGNRPLDVAPGTGFGGALSVAVFHDLRLTTIGRGFASALRGGANLARQPGVTLRTDVKALTITAPRPFPHQVDGDFLGRVDVLEVGCRPSCLDVFVP